MSEIKLVRIEPRVCPPNCPEEGQVAELVIGCTLDSEDGKNSAYVDGIKQFDPCITVEELNANLSDICSQFIANQDWKNQLTSQLEAQAKQNVNISAWQAPEVVLVDKEPEEGSPANPIEPVVPEPEPTPEPEPVEEEEEEEDTTSE